MRQLITILVLAIVAIAARGQTATFDLDDINQSYKLVSTNYTLTNTTAIWFKYKIARDNPITFDYQYNLDSLTGDHTSIAIAIYGRIFTSDDWTLLSTTTATNGTGTANISQTVPLRIRELKIEYTGTGTGTSRIDEQILKIWY